MFSLNKEHHWNLWMHHWTRHLQLDVKAGEMFFQVWNKGADADWDFLTLGYVEGWFVWREL